MKKYNVNFPEKIFTANARKTHQWDTLDANLRRIAKEETDVLFCGIVRNGGKYLERNLQRLKHSASFFRESKMFIYENNSTDNTKDILKEYEQINEYNLEVLSEDIEGADYKTQDDTFNRCTKIANARNKYMDVVREDASKFSATVMVDLDLIGGWSYEGLYANVVHLLNNGVYSNITGVTSYGVITTGDHNWSKIDLESVSPKEYSMYDSFAFRPLEWFREEREANKEKGLDKRTQVSYNSISRPLGNAIVGSNFGGLGIYKSKNIRDLRYRSQQYDDDNVQSDSEHVPFHRDIFNNGHKLSINNRLLVSYSPHRYS